MDTVLCKHALEDFVRYLEAFTVRILDDFLASMRSVPHRRQAPARTHASLVDNHVEKNGLGETRTPTSFRTSAPKTDASAIPPRGLLGRDRSLTVAHPSLAA